jgi:hypothetical protein
MAGVFISYRREDSPGHAGRIFDRLEARFGADIVFMDVHALDAGVDFAAAIDRAVGSSAALLAIIGPDWLAAADGDGRRRLDDPRDFVRLEIGGALKRGIPVVPVLVDDADLPAADDLPHDLRPLVGRHAVVLRDSRWDADFDELAQSLERLIKALATRETRRTSPSAGGVFTTARVWGAVAGLVAIVGGAAVVTRGCVPRPDETGASATAPAVTAPVTRTDSSSPSSSDSDSQEGGLQPAIGVTPEPRPAAARRGVLGIGWFGLWLDTITDNPRGVIVGHVSQGGPAARAGIEVDDVLIEVAGRPVASFADVENAVVGHVRNEAAAPETTVQVVREGKTLELPVVFDRGHMLRR